MYELFDAWFNDFQITIDEVRERVQWADWSPETWAEAEYWCVLFYGQHIFE